MKTSNTGTALEPIAGQLWTIGAKMQGIGFLLGHQAPDSLPNSDESYGIG